MESISASSDFPARAAARPARLEPVTSSWNPLVWLALAAYRAATGGTSPIRIIFARAPRLILAHLILITTAEYGLSLDRRLRALARVFGSRVNGCLFCDDLETRIAIQHRAISQEDADALPHFATSERFSPRERAALRYVEELNTTRRAGDGVFEDLKRHLSEREIVELTWLNAVGNYLNLQAKPLGLLPDDACALPGAGPR
ncbi:MAG: carboxymuconolactone decarboxylase family protein [Candidatus Binatia bacterium]